MDMSYSVLTPKEIYQSIKEKPYRDGEALIIEYAKSMCIAFFKWENEHISCCPKLTEDFANKTVSDFFYKSVNTVMPIISERDKVIQAVIELVENMQDDGNAFPNDFIDKLKRVKYRIK
jgi:hypothetical protein